jgi:hypothetical protein
MLDKATAAMNAAWGIGIQTGALSVTGGIRIFEGIVRPILEYGCQIWPAEGTDKWQHAEDIQKKMGKRILRVGDKTPNEVVYGELGWWTLRGRRMLLRLKFWWKLIHMSKTRMVRRMYEFSREVCNANANKLKKDRVKNWCTYTKQILAELDLVDIWDDEDVGEMSDWEARIREAIQAKEQETWWAGVEKNKVLVTYAKIKKTLEREEYLAGNEDAYGRVGLTRLRAGNNCLRINTDRWNAPGTPRDDRVCDQCFFSNNFAWLMEDEAHFMQDCPSYADERTQMRKRRSDILGKKEIIIAGESKARELERWLGQAPEDATQEERRNINLATMQFVRLAMKKRKRNMDIKKNLLARN